MKKEQLVGEWKQVGLEFNGIKKGLSERSISWTFLNEGRAFFTITDLETQETQLDESIFAWSIEKIGKESIVILDDSPHYKIVFIDEMKLSLETIPQKLIYHFEKQL